MPEVFWFPKLQFILILDRTVTDRIFVGKIRTSMLFKTLIFNYIENIRGITQLIHHTFLALVLY